LPFSVDIDFDRIGFHTSNLLLESTLDIAF